MQRGHVLTFRHFIATGLGGLVLCLAGCSQTPTSDTDQQSVIASTLESTQWLTFEDPAAVTYQQQCQADYNLALMQFRTLETQPFQALALLDAINGLDITLDRFLSSASLTRNVHPNAKVREAADECQQKGAAIVSEMGLSVALYSKIKQVPLDNLKPLDQRYVTKMLEDFERSGVNQPADTRKKITKLNEEILLLGQTFNKNTREDVRTVYTTVEALEGLPQDFIDAHPADEQGRVAITTQYPDYLPVMQYAKSDDFRLELYKAFRNRAYPDNKTVLEQLLQKRFEYAALLGYDNFAQYITANKMIGSAKNAEDFINKINRIAKPRAALDTEELLVRLQKIDPKATTVGDWQKTYLENLIKNETYKVDAQEVRQYFSYPAVKQGIFDLVEHLFQVTIEPWETEVWHPSVQAYRMTDKNGLVGEFYLDMHPREGKYSHAAAFGIREGVLGIQTPVAALVCNFPGGEGGPALMEHDQVETFLHEFGHLLHGLFGGHQPRLALSGINTEWDFVEAPSQMLEEWVWDAETLKTFAKNAKGETIPAALVDKMNNARMFGKGIWTRQQMYYAAISLNAYNQPANQVDLDKMLVELQQEYAPFEYVSDTHMYAAFGHLYGYSAIYYTYMWSLVIAADMFSEFEKMGLRNTQVANHYREAVLAPGGTKDAADLVSDFLGRPYSFDAFAKTLSVE